MKTIRDRKTGNVVYIRKSSVNEYIMQVIKIDDEGIPVTLFEIDVTDATLLAYNMLDIVNYLRAARAGRETSKIRTL